MKISPVTAQKPRMSPVGKGKTRFDAVAALATTRADRWRNAGVEPCLEDIFADPIVHLLLRRDGLTVADVRAVVEKAQQTLRS